MAIPLLSTSKVQQPTKLGLAWSAHSLSTSLSPKAWQCWVTVSWTEHAKSKSSASKVLIDMEANLTTSRSTESSSTYSPTKKPKKLMKMTTGSVLNLRAWDPRLAAIGYFKNTHAMKATPRALEPSGATRRSTLSSRIAPQRSPMSLSTTTQVETKRRETLLGLHCVLTMMKISTFKATRLHGIPKPVLISLCYLVARTKDMTRTFAKIRKWSMIGTVKQDLI